MRDAAAEQSHLFPWHLACSILKGSLGVQPVPSSSVGQGLTDGFCLACWGKAVCPSCVFLTFLEESLAWDSHSHQLPEPRSCLLAGRWAPAEFTHISPPALRSRTAFIASINRGEIKWLSAVKRFPFLFHLSSQGLRVCWQYWWVRLTRAWRAWQDGDREVNLPAGGVGSPCWRHRCCYHSCHLFTWQQPFSGWLASRN